MSAPGYATLLKEWLPAVWRERDETGDLADLLAVYGELLDAFHETLEQRLHDSFPDRDADGHHCQDWLLPYFAQLLDVRLVSPDEDGRRAELADAVAWRQRKGTRVSIERIAEAVGRFEVEIQEGWKRVAITPRVDRPLLPESAYGEEPIPSNAPPAERARHPALPAATVDLRYCSRAVRCEASDPAAHETTFAGESIPWRQANRHGLPCTLNGQQPHLISHTPNSFQDVSRRTVDLRTPNWRRGHAHPRRVPLFHAPQEGFFSSRYLSLSWSAIEAKVIEFAGTDVSGWSDAQATVHTIDATVDGEAVAILEISLRKTRWNDMDLPWVAVRGLTDAPLRLRGVFTLEQAAVYRFENLWLDNKAQIDAGAAQLVNCAARQFKVTTAERDAPVISARACLFKKIEATRGLVQLEYVTVIDTLLAEHLRASDAILLPPLRKDTVDDDVPAAGCIRYSRVPYLPEPAVPSEPYDPDEPWLDNDPDWRADGQRSSLLCYADSCTTARPLFWNLSFGQPGCGVLHPDAKAAFRFGAEDGGEMGACHDLRYTLREQAVLDKLAEFLPVGMEAVLVADPSLSCAPPKANKS
ncbi:MAG: phage tail protein [Betaproteobacteria bacterium]|nr:phage tail protein [Betaproteobacteria bacterium]